MINPISAIKAYFTIKAIANEEIKEIRMQTKSTWLSTEFISHAAVQLGAVYATVHGFIPPKYDAIIAIVGSSVYMICRTAYKAYTDVRRNLAPTTQVDAQTVVVNK